MRVFRRHVESELLTALEGTLPRDAARRVEAHLAGCSRCREARDQIARGLRFARALPETRLPEARAAAIVQALRGAPTRPPSLPSRWLVPTAAAVVIITGAVSWQAAQAPRIESAPQDEPPSAFEQMAIDLHERGLPASGSAALTTASISEARAWGRRRTGVDVNLPALRPAEDDGRFDLRGVQAFEYRGARALGVRYSVDGRPVTLTVAHARDVPDGAPAWTLAGKRVRSRGAGGHKVLSWTNSGQTYVLVSDLPADGLRACFVCHTQPARRALIEQLAR